MRISVGDKVKPKDEQSKVYWTVIRIHERILELHGPDGDIRHIPFDEFKYDWRRVK
jgi:hypothetical protein